MGLAQTGTRRWHVHVRRAALVVAAMAVAGLGLHAAQEPASQPSAQAVRVVIDYGDGVEKHFTKIAWRKGMTVLDALEAAKGHARGIRSEHRGSGQTAFVTQIDDLKNEGARGAARNWTFRVNENLSDRGAGVRELEAGDTVRWVYSARGVK